MKEKAVPGNYVATSTILIDAPTSQVWSVITDPESIQEFMFGTTVVTDWTVGSPINWRGEWKGKAYEDKGVILAVEPGKRLVHTHFSPLSGQADVPENYHTLTWTLEETPLAHCRDLRRPIRVTHGCGHTGSSEDVCRG